METITSNTPNADLASRSDSAGPVALSLDEVQAASGGIWPIVAAFALGALASEVYHHHR
jgi:hypothetical protein